MKALAVVNDLLFGSRIHAVAKELNASVATVRRGQDLLARAREEKPDLVLVDLATADLQAIAALKAELKTIPIVGWYHHTSPQLAEDAARAGVDRVMTKGEFTKKLPELLAAL